MKFNKIIMNPPFTEKVNEKAYKPLDFPIYQLAMAENPSAEVVCLMRQSNKNRWKAGKYTDYDENITFPDVSCNVAIFVHDPKKPTICIKSKYEENGKLDWIRENELKNGYSIEDFIDKRWDLFKDIKVVPKGYCALNEVSTKNFSAFEEGEAPIKKNGDVLKMLLFIRTKDSHAMKEWLLNVVNPLHNEFRNKYGDIHIARGFTRCIEVPEDLRP